MGTVDGWTDERVSFLKSEWAMGRSAGQIARELRMTRNAVIGKVHRLNLPSRERAPAQPRAPREHRNSGGVVRSIRARLAQQNKTATPNAEGAFANKDPKLRLLRSAKTAATDRYDIGGNLKTRHAPKPITLPSGPVQLEPAAEAATIEDTAPPSAPADVTTGGIGLLDLNNESCRWPVGDPGKPGFFFCGEAKADLSAGRPYCGGPLCNRFMTTEGRPWA
jgi:GcrA cell cycle regulator